MKNVDYSTTFRRELKKAHRQGKDTNRLHAIIELLRGDEPLPFQYKDHLSKATGKAAANYTLPLIGC